MADSRFRGTWLIGLFALMVAFCFASGARGEAESYQEQLKRQSERWAAEEREEQHLKAEWQKRHAEARQAVEKARELAEDTRKARIRAGDGMYQGVKRSEWTKRWKTAQEKLAEAEDELAELPREARRAGVPPGWLRSPR